MITLNESTDQTRDRTRKSKHGAVQTLFGAPCLKENMSIVFVSHLVERHTKIGVEK
jgi:hypothetical protein